MFKLFLFLLLFIPSFTYAQKGGGDRYYGGVFQLNESAMISRQNNKALKKNTKDRGLPLTIFFL